MPGNTRTRDPGSQRFCGILRAITLCAVTAAQLASARPAAAAGQDTLFLGQPIRFRAQIDAFLEQDRVTPPPTGSILFIGSSIFRQWTDLGEQMAPLPVFNRAFGGSRTAEVLYYMDRIVLPYRPKIIVYYCGSNDVNAGEKPADIFHRFQLFSDRVRDSLPGTMVFFVSIHRAPQKQKRLGTVDSTNALVRAYCAAAEQREFIDMNPILFDARGNPRLELYKEDLLHFKRESYREFAALVKPILEQAWKEVGRPRILGLARLRLFAHDLRQSALFYRDFLGYTGDVHAGRETDLLLITLNDRQSIELTPERDAGSDRMDRITLETDDARAMRTYLATQGVIVPEGVTNTDGDIVFHVTDPDGHAVEFIQRGPDGLTGAGGGAERSAPVVSGRLRHAGFTASSLERSLTFYGEILGCRETWRGSSDGRQLSWVNLRLPEGEEYLELMLTTGSPARAQLGSMNHLSLEVGDLPRTLAALENSPGRKEYPRTMELRVGKNRKRQLNLFDPDGTRVELMEPATVDGVPAPSSQAPPPRQAR